MFSPCRDSRRRKCRQRIAVFTAAGALALVTGCEREERDFGAGGPHRPPAPDTSLLAEATDASHTRGPQNQAENNAFALSEGKRLYGSFNCVGCHANGGGDIGPALMDARWLYGAAPAEVYRSIMDGRPNGMPAFRDRLTDSQARQLTAYVRSLSGQAARNAAPSRDDHMKASPPENSTARVTPHTDAAVRPTNVP